MITIFSSFILYSYEKEKTVSEIATELFKDIC